MEPNIFVGREQPGKFGSNDTDDVAEHRYQDHTTIESQDETCSTRRPDGIAQGIESSQSSIGFL